jgi:hypothetical protein
MTLEELIVLYREQAFDKAEPYFCSDELLTIYLNEAQDEACRRGELLRSSAAEFCTVGFLTDASSVALDPRIVRIKSARVNGKTARVVTSDMMDELFPEWRNDTSRTTPTHLIEGEDTGMLGLWPRPSAAGTVSLTVQRMAIDRLANDTDIPEIRPELHPSLVDWALYRAHSREDQEIFNEVKAAKALIRFEAEFGRKASGRNEAWSRSGERMNAAPIA